MSAPGGWQLAANATQRLAAAGCLASAYGFVASGFADPRWLAAIVASALIVATAPASWTAGDQDPLPGLDWPRRAEMWTWFVPGWLLMLGAAAGKAAGVPPHAATWCWVAGAAWLTIGAWRASARVPRLPTRRSVWAWAALVVLVATALRVWRMDSVPRYVHHDEFVMPVCGLRYLVEGFDWFTVRRDAGLFTNMPLAFIPVGIGVWIGGVDLFWARLPDVVMGIASVWLVFDGLRRVASTPVAVVTALLVAANHAHMHYSRVAATYITSAFFAALLFALASRLWTRPTYLTAALFGLAGVLGMQTYHASLATLPLAAAALLALAPLRPRRWRTLVAPLAIAAISAACAAAIFGVALCEARDIMFLRNRDVSIFAPAAMATLQERYETTSPAVVVARQAWRSLQAFHFGLDQCEQYGIDRPLTDSASAALLIAGAILALTRPRRFLPVTAFAVTAGYLILGLGLQNTTCHNRVTAALPLGMVFPALAIVQCCTVLWGGRARLLAWLRGLSIAALVALCIHANLDLYFRYYPGSLGWGSDHGEAAWIAREYADRYTVHLVSWSFKYGPWDSQRLILGDLPVERNDTDSDAAYIAGVQPTGSDLFIVSGQLPASRDALLARFPAARVEVARRDPTRGPELYLVFLGEPRAGAAQPH